MGNSLDFIDPALQEAKLMAEKHRIEYKTYRSHSALQQWKAP